MTKRTKTAHLLALLAAAGLLLSACGDDSGGSSRRKRPKYKKSTTAVGGKKAGLEVYRKIEDVAVIESNQRCHKRCTKAKTPAECVKRCLVKSAWDMRHTYKDASDAPRDPFYSYVLKTDNPTDGVVPNSAVAKSYCPLKDMRAPDLRESVKDPRARRAYSVKSLRLQGIIGRGTRRMALFVDPTGYAHIVRKGNCLGKEKVRVREVGVEMVQLEIKPDDDKPPVQLKPIELHRKEIIGDGLADAGQTEGDDSSKPKPSTPPGVLNRKRPRPQRPPGIPKR